MAHLTEEQEYLLLGKIGGLLSPEEEREWEALLQHNADVQSAYDTLIRKLPPEEVADSFQRIKQDAAWKDLAALYKDQIISPVKIRRTALYRKLAAACVLLLLAAGGWLYYRHLPAPNAGQVPAAVVVPSKPGIQLALSNGHIIDLSAEKGNIAAPSVRLTNQNKALSYAFDTKVTGQAKEGINRLTVPIGTDYKINLSDGTEVWLNSATQLDFPFAFTGATREITINGEAYLKVARVPSQPFIVHLPGSSVQVLGTEFNVNTYDSGVVKVALVAGAVNLHSSDGESRLAPGKEAVYRPGSPIRQQSFDPKMVLSWRDGLFYFNGATLSEINKVVPRWFGIAAVIDNPAINGREFVGVLDRNQPIQVFLDNLKAIAKIDAYLDSNKVLHFR